MAYSKGVEETFFFFSGNLLEVHLGTLTAEDHPLHS